MSNFVLILQSETDKGYRYSIPPAPSSADASFLVWIDCRALGLSHEQLVDLFVNKAHLALNDGEMFGKGGEGFMRMNVGSPRSVLLKARQQLEAAL